MKHKHLFYRLAAGALCLALLLTLLPTTVTTASASDSGTYAEEAVTIDLTGGVTAESREVNFNADWKFYLGTLSNAYSVTYNDASWDTVTLPHDFSIIQDFTTSGEAESGFLPGGTGWYRKTFTLDESCADSTIVINFDGVYSDAYVYVNGTYVGEHHYGYTSFAFDITDYLVCDGTTENVIAVKAVNNIPSSRWYSGSGIYRDVTLIITDAVHVAYNGTYVTTPNISKGDGTVNAEVELDNDSASAVTVTVSNTVYDSDGKVASTTASTTTTIAAGSTATVTTTPVVSDPQLWSCDDPNLYYVLTEVYVGGSLVDSYTTEFGFRWYSFDSTNGFMLNGVATKLNGVCLHHDQGALGSAASYDAMYRQLSIMKDMGVNAIRTSHNPADEDFISICNELGLLVIEEAFDGWVDAKNGNSNDFSAYFSKTISSDNNLINADSSMTWAEYAIKSMVKRDRNAPSVILWSLGNEVQEGTSWTNSSSYATIAQNLIDWINELDTSRMVTSGDNNRGSSSDLIAVLNVILKNGGIVGFNYGSDLSSLASTYGGVILASETSSAVNSRGVYTTMASLTMTSSYHLTSYDTSTVSWGMTAHDSLWRTLTNDYIAGEFVWTGFDYIGEPTPKNGTGSGSVTGSGAIPNSSYFGIVDTAGFEKDTYYLYRAQWNQSSTTLHLVTAWDSDNMYTTSGKTPVVIYSNAAKVELYRNGTLIGTATRTVNTTAAGYTYYTYSVASNNSSICTASSGSGSTSLYATFYVTYASGTISAIAYDENGNVIEETYGNSSVSTPGTVSKLVVSQDKTEITADGESLVYISVDVTDASGNLDTTADNTIYFELEGEGEIVGVDNGDQATTEKFQQASVLTSSTSAHIAAYAGKALVIVRSTTSSGTITVKVTSSGLTGSTVTVTTTAEESTSSSGLVSYTMVRDYSIKVGTVPVLETTATGTLADGTTITGTITWSTISEAVYGTAGDYTIAGTLDFGECGTVDVSCRLHVIDNVIAMRNISVATISGVVPDLPDEVTGVLADGTLSGTFSVVWDEVTASQLTTVGTLLTVNGIATVLGEETLPVTATIRVAEAVNEESTNVATAATVEQDVPSAYTSDNLSSVNDGTQWSTATTGRWSNYNYRNYSSTATLTLTWDTAVLLESLNVFYYVDSYSAALPDSVEISYSLDGTTYTTIGYTAEQVATSGSTGYEYTYTLDAVINPVSVKITFTQQSGHCVAVTEIETMTYAASFTANSSAALSGIAVDGTAISGFSSTQYSYTAETSGSGTVTATTEENAGITILPVYQGVVRILTISEDSSEAFTYAVTISGTCSHESTALANAVAATCTTAGYTGDTVCLLCGEILAAGTVTAATGHSYDSGEVTTAPTCTESGVRTFTCTACSGTCTEAIAPTGHSYTGLITTPATCTTEGVKTYTCSACGDSYTESIAATGHSWDSGTVTKEATDTETGIMTYTCTVCGETKTETISIALLAPSVTLEVSATDDGGIQLTATVEDWENGARYYEITAHGFVYITKTSLGSRILTTSTSGKTKVTINGYTSTGSYGYCLTPKTSSTIYAVRAFLSYVDSNGYTRYVYSDKIYVSYSDLAE